MHRTIADDATGEPIKVLTGFTTATVFDVSQTEGIPLPPGPTPEDLPQSEAERISRRLRRTLSDPLLLAEECYEPALGRLIDWPPPLHATR